MTQMRVSEFAARHGFALYREISVARPASDVGRDLAVVREPATALCDANSVPAAEHHTPVPECAFFKASRNLFPDGSATLKPGLEVATSRRQLQAQARVRAGRIAHPLIVRMSSDRLFLDRVGRHQSPSPLRRQEQLTTHSPSAHPKPELSTLPETGTFYFALTPTSCVGPCRSGFIIGWRAEARS
jgi:hypothetical protein